VPSVASSAEDRPLVKHSICLASRSSLQLRIPILEAQRCGNLVVTPQLLTLRLCQRPQLAAGGAEGHGDARISSTLHSWLKMMHCSSPLSAASAIAARALCRRVICTVASHDYWDDATHESSGANYGPT
jgi:hypothetical protein